MDGVEHEDVRSRDLAAGQVHAVDEAHVELAQQIQGFFFIRGLEQARLELDKYSVLLEYRNLMRTHLVYLFGR